MAEAKIIHFMAIDSMLAPVSMMKRIWQRNADHFMQQGALKVISSTATNSKFTLNYPFKFVSKSIWKLDQFREFAKDLDVSKLETKWTVYINNIGSFITAAVDFKDLKPSLDVEFITSSKFDKIIIAVRCRKHVSEDDSSFLQRSKAGEHLKQIVNEILCFDYDNFLGYILYKRLDLNNHTTDIENQQFYDWVVEVFLGDKGASYSLDMLSGKAKELNDNGFDVRYGVFTDTDCLPSKIKSVSPPAHVGT